MAVTVVDSVLFVVSGLLLDMGLFHVFNWSESTRHPQIGRSKKPKLTSTIYGLSALFVGLLIPMALHYQFELGLNTLCILAGFGSWAVFLAVTAERLDDRARQRG